MKKLFYAIAALIAAGFVSTAATRSPKSAVARNIDVFNSVMKELQTNYVDSIDVEASVRTAIDAMLETLDPYTEYIPRDKRDDFNSQNNGIGAMIVQRDGGVYIEEPYAGAPSAKAGLKAGDLIVAIDGDTMLSKPSSTVSERLRGAPGSTIKVTVKRPYTPDSILVLDVTREKIRIPSVPYFGTVAPGIGYIALTQFTDKSADEVKTALKTLMDTVALKGLVFDLRDNGGGYLNAAIDIANEFLGKKELIVYTEGRRNPRSEFFAKGTGEFQHGRLIVLVDEFSASASEIVTGAVQDWDRGVVVGRRSFGKGLVQRPIDLPDGSMIRLTVARYYTPAGRCIQKPYESIEKYNEDLIDRYNKGEMMSEDSIHFPDSLKFKTHKLARTVYGGGGIMPDYFVPIDTTLYTKYHRQLRDKGALMKAHFHFMDAHRKEWLGKYKTFNEFYKRFEVTPDMLAQLVATGKEMGVEYHEDEYQKALPLLKLQMKALIARDLWDMNEYYHVINDANESIKKALELLEQPDFEGLLLKRQ